MRCEIFDRIYLIGSGRFGYTHPLNCNVYAIVGATDVAIVDAGCGFDVDNLIASLEAHGLSAQSVDLMVLTHADWDHARGASELKRRTGCRVAIHASGKERVEESFSISIGDNGVRSITFEPVRVDIALADGDVIDLGGRTLTVLHTPGHTDDSVCLELNEGGKKILFTGDTVHAGGKPGIVTANTDFRAYYSSVSRLATLRADAMLPGHGIFVLEGAHDHIEHLRGRLGGKWFDLGAAPYPPPFDSGAWYSEMHPELLLGP